MKLQHLFVAVVAAVLLSGCSTPTRTDVDQFKLVFSGKINSKDVSLFSECVLEGFDPLQSVGYNPRHIQQLRRGTNSRIDSRVSNNAVLWVSVDINDNGHVELFETTVFQGPILSKQPEYDVFNFCLKKYEKL